MSSGLEARIIKLEQSQQSEALRYVRRVMPDGSTEPLAPGERCAPFVAELPAVCTSADEWATRHRPPSA